MSGIEGLLRGRTLAGRYHVEEVIGRGGMGAVYRARDERLGRAVAVKVVALSGPDEEARERLRSRFQREARSAAALPHHPNVVPVYDYGTDPELGLDFLVMELLRGEDLASYFQREGAPPLSTGLRILHAAARGVGVGHRAGMIHRDVKPGNIFLVRTSDGEAQVRILDFGIAKLVDDDTLQQLTQDGRVPHSPAFASPEQLRGLANLTPASDVFGLGAVGFQLLTGQRPFTESDRNRMALGMPVEVPTLRDLNPAVPADVEDIVRRALHFEPRDRFADATEMSTALGEALRKLTDRPVDPYAAVPLATPPRSRDASPPAEEAPDTTRLLPSEPDDRTLLAPGAAGAPDGAPPVSKQRQAFPRRQPPPKKKGNRAFVWTLLLLLLAAGAVFAWIYFEEQDRVATSTVPPPPEDELPERVEVDFDDEQVPLDEQLRGDPDVLDAFAFDQEGRRFAMNQQFDSAAVQFRRAVEMDPEDPDYRYNLGIALRRLQRHGEAAEQLQRALQFGYSPAGPAYYNLGLAQLAQGDTMLAQNSLSRVSSENAETRIVGAAELLLRRLRSRGEQAETTAPTEPTEPADTQRSPQPRDTVRMDSLRGAGGPLGGDTRSIRREIPMVRRDTLPARTSGADS